MAKFCSDECKDTGSICDFCKNFKGNYNEDNTFEGDGMCIIQDKTVEACDGYMCDDFVCFNIK